MTAYLQHLYIPRKMLYFMLLTAWAVAPIVLLVEKFLFSDWQFAAFLAVAVAVDTFTGAAKGLKMGEFSSRELGQGVLAKVIAYGAALIIVHVLMHAPVRGAENQVLGAIVPYIDATIYAFILIREAISIVENLGAFGIQVLPKWVRARFQQWDETGQWIGSQADKK